MNLEKSVACSSILALAVALAGTPAFARDFTVKAVVGDCEIKTPAESDYSPAEPGSQYPWGSRLRTGAESQLVLELAEGGECRVMPNALVTINRDRRTLRVSIEKGVAQFALTETFRANTRLEAETPTLVCTPTGTRFSLGMVKQPDLDMVVANVAEGSLAVAGKRHPVPVFDIPTLNEGDRVSVSAARARTWYRIKNHKGTFVVLVPGEDGDMKPVELKEEQTIRIVIGPSEDDPSLFNVTVLLIGEDQETPIEAWTTQRQAATPPPDVDTVLEPAEFPVPTTTTTTIPSPTPVGYR